MKFQSPWRTFSYFATCFTAFVQLSLAHAEFTPAQQAYVKAANPGPGDLFGASVAIQGDTLVVGARREDSNAIGANGDPFNDLRGNSGAAYVFVRLGTNWVQQAYLKSSNPDANDEFGASVAIFGDTIVVGAPFEDSSSAQINGNQNDNSLMDAGAAYVFVRTGTNWTQQAYLKASAPLLGGNNFGGQVTIFSNTIAVGATGGNCFAQVFERSGTNWIAETKMVGQLNFNFGSQFGQGLALVENTLVVGAPMENSVAGSDGAIYTFERNGTNWVQQARLLGTQNRLFGYSVSLAGDTLVAGGPFGSATGANVYTRSGTNWILRAYVAPAGLDPNDRFGYAVAAASDTIVITAYSEDSVATGINGNRADNSSSGSGAAYVFVRSGTNWIEKAYVKASNTGANDRFGHTIALSGYTMVVAARDEDSNATGVNGDQTNNSATDAGAVYVFDGIGAGPSISIHGDAANGYFTRFYGHPGFQYRLERAGEILGQWESIQTGIAPLNGFIEFHDSNPLPGQSFYRIAQP